MKLFNQWFKYMTKPWAVASVALLMICSFLYLDKPVANFCHHLQLGYFQHILERVTHLGKAKSALGVLFILALVFRYLWKKRTWEMKAWFLWLCTFVPSVIVLGLKILFGRARPELLFDQGEYGFKWMQFERMHWSFPSGHTATMMGLVFGLCIVWPRYRFLFLGVGLLVMISRIVLFQHYLSDVMISLYLAFIEIGILQWLLTRYAPEFMQEVYN